VVSNKISPDLREALQNSGPSASRISLILQGEELKNPWLSEFLIVEGLMTGDQVSSNTSPLFYGDNTFSMTVAAFKQRLL
jgi:hypothetical protein